MEEGDRFPVDNFPQVWLNVYDKLDPKDKLAFTGASSVWHDWVEPKRTESLISEVALYLLEPCRPVHWERALQARELCQSWKEGIDQENQTHGSNTSLRFEIAADELDEGPHRWHPCRRSLLYGNFFSFVGDVHEFMQEMRTHPRNPFPGRSIGLICQFEFVDEHEDLSEEWRDYWRSIISLLEKFGSYVHFAQIRFEDYRQLQLGNVEIQAQLRECLLHLPNLKQVQISCEHTSPLLEDEIRVFYRLNPLPQLEHIETVELDNTSPGTDDEVLNSCCVPANVKRVSIDRHGQEHPEHLPLSEAVYGFVNLEVLQASILLRDLERLASLERRPPLRELDLTFEGAPYIEDVFMLLEPFAETLIQFRSDSRMRSKYYVMDGEPFSCNLPHLKKIFFVEYWGKANPLSQFKSLSRVKIWIMALMPYLQWLSLGNAATVYERNVMEQPRQDCIDNHDTTGLHERTWSQDCRLVLVEVMSSVLTDFFHGLLF